MNITLNRKAGAPLTAAAETGLGGGDIRQSIVIDRPVSEVYAFCHNLENLPSFVCHVESITMLDAQNSYWVVRSSKNHIWAWGVEVTGDRQNDTISWRSHDDADIQAAGSVQFRAGPDNRGTVVTLALQYSRPGEKFLAASGEVLKKDVQTMIGEDMFRLKTLLESGKIPAATVQTSYKE